MYIYLYEHMFVNSTPISIFEGMSRQILTFTKLSRASLSIETSFTTKNIAPLN